MSYLILNGAAVPEDLQPNPLYRGTMRRAPTYCESALEDHEVNRLFMWYLEEGGETGALHDLALARRYVKLLNIHVPGRNFEVVELTDGETPPTVPGHFLGFDLSLGHNNSLLWSGLRYPMRKIPPPPFDVLCDLLERFFAPQLNESGLFESYAAAEFCLRSIAALQSLRRNLYEGDDLSDFRVAGIYLVKGG